VRGNLFLHAPMRFSLAFPDGWEITNSDEQVVAQEPGNKVFIVMRTIEPRAGRSLEQAALMHMREAGYRSTNAAMMTINGLPAFVGSYEGNASGIGKVMARGAHIEQGRTTFFIGGIAPPDLYPRVAGEFDRTIQSFRQLTQAEADAIRPNLLDFYTVREGDTWQSIAQRSGGLASAATLAIMNEYPIDQQPAPGTRLKVVVAGS
jgi:predicted Zn-dependent protease